MGYRCLHGCWASSAPTYTQSDYISVEWMKQFYVAEGEPFEAFGFEEDTSRWTKQHNIPAQHGKKEEKNEEKYDERNERTFLALTAITMIASVVTAQEVDNSSTVDAYKYIGAGIALGLCGIGTGYSQSQIGAAAVGMVAEGNFGRALLFTVLPETIVLFGLLAFFL